MSAHAGSTGPRSMTSDEEAFEAFFQHYQRDIFHYVWRLTQDEQAAHDLAQEAFLRAWERFATVRAYDQPRAWLFRVATNLAIDYQRHHAQPARAHVPLDEGQAMTDPSLRVVERLDDDAATRAALLTLSARQRAALVLRVAYQQSCAQIAATLGISPVAARMTLSRARAQFRTAFFRHNLPENGR